MSKRVFVVDDPNVASEVEALLRSRGLSQMNKKLPSMNEVANARPVSSRGFVNEGEFPFFKRVAKEMPRVQPQREVNPSPFSWRDGASRTMGVIMNDIVREMQNPRPQVKRPYEMSCGTFTPPTPPSRLFVGGACGGYEVADAHDVMMGRQLYRSNGCGGFEPISYPSGGCGGTTHDIGGCGGWRTNYISGCGGTTYRSGC